MLRMPGILSYPNFTHFLQQQQQIRHLLDESNVLSCSEASTGTLTPSPSPPLSLNDGKSSANTKSFTIDAILGIRDQNTTQQKKFVKNKSNTRTDFNFGISDVRRLTSTGISRDGLTRSDGISDGNPRIPETEKPSSIISDSKKCGGTKSKRVRTIFTPEQLERLEAEFERQQYMVGPERLYLAHTLNLTEAQVKVWFQNRRIKWRKQHLEIQQQRLAAIKQQQQKQQEQQNNENNVRDISDADDEDVDDNESPDDSCTQSDFIYNENEHQTSIVNVQFCNNVNHRDSEFSKRNLKCTESMV